MNSPFKNEKSKKKDFKSAPKKKFDKPEPAFQCKDGERVEIRGKNVVKITNVMGKDKGGKAVILKAKSSYVGSVKKLKHLFPKWEKKGWLKKNE